MVWLYRMIFGYVKVRFCGEFKERVLTACASGGIALWGTKTEKDGIECFMLARDFKYLRILTSFKGVRVRILKKTGIPFITCRYKKRAGILVGFVLFFTVLEFMSGYIWIIDVNGNYAVSEKEILSACYSIGIKEGIRKNSFYPKAEREKLLLKLDKIAWASLNIEGSRLTVNVSERKENTEKKFYSNLKADFDGIITKMDIVSGTSVVKVGQAVKKGDLLVSGIIETADYTRFVNSKGVVLADTKRKIVLKENYKQTVRVPTGKVKQKFVLEIFKIKLPLYFGKETKDYTGSKSKETLSVFGQNVPITLHKKRFEFHTEKEINYSYEELCKKLENRFNNELAVLKYESCKVEKKKFSRAKDGVKLIVTLNINENIAFEDKLIINAGN